MARMKKVKIATVFQRTLLILLGVGIVVTGAVGAFFLIHRTPLPAEVLPADEVVSYWHATDRDAVQKEASFARRAELPQLRPGFDLAVLRNGWIVFPSVPGEIAGARRTGDGLSYVASDDGAAALLEGSAPRLSNDPAFRALTGGFAPDLPLLFSRVSATPGTTAAEWMLGNPTATLFTQQGARSTVRLYVSAGDAPWAAPLPVPVLDPPPAMSLTMSAPAETVTRYLASLPPQERTLKAAMLATGLQRMLGSDVSLEFDLFPLLQSRATLAMGTASGGTVPWVLEGEARGAGVEKLLRDFHASAGGAGRGSVSVRQFEDGVTVPQVSAGGASGLRETEQGGWTVLTSPQLITALRGDRFVVSNSSAWMGQMTRETGQTVPLPLSNGQFLMGGVIAGDDTPFFSVNDPGLRAVVGPLPPAFRWSMEQLGQVRQLSWEELRE